MSLFKKNEPKTNDFESEMIKNNPKRKDFKKVIKFLNEKKINSKNIGINKILKSQTKTLYPSAVCYLNEKNREVNNIFLVVESWNSIIDRNTMLKRAKEYFDSFANIFFVIFSFPTENQMIFKMETETKKQYAITLEIPNFF